MLPHFVFDEEGEACVADIVRAYGSTEDGLGLLRSIARLYDPERPRQHRGYEAFIEAWRRVSEGLVAVPPFPSV